MYKSKSGANDKYDFDSAAKSYNISFSSADKHNLFAIASIISILGAALKPFSIFERYSGDMPIFFEKFLREIPVSILFLFINAPKVFSF